MTDLRKAAKMALDVLGDVETSGWTTKAAAREVMQALRQALAHPEYQTVSAPQPQTFTGQAPVAWEQFHTPDSPLYTAPPKREWVGLEDEDVTTVKNEFNRGALWAEQVLKEKNT